MTSEKIFVSPMAEFICVATEDILKNSDEESTDTSNPPGEEVDLPKVPF